MAKNPKRALEALTAGGEKVDGIAVREITLGLAAVLERIESPLVVPRPEGAAMRLRDMLPTVYAMTRPAAESEALLTEGGPDMLMEEAVRWADGLTTGQGVRLAEACVRAASRVARVSPQGVPEKEGGAEGNANAAGTAG